MTSFICKTIFISVTSAGGFAIFAGLIWALFLGMLRNRKSSGSRDIFKSTFSIRGTIEDTLKQIEKQVRELYRLPLEISAKERNISFIHVLKPSFRNLLKLPFENASFTLNETDKNIIHIQYSVSVGILRKKITALVSALFVLISVPLFVLISYSVMNAIFPTFQVQGDLTHALAMERKTVLLIFNIVHVIWPPYLLLLLFHKTVSGINTEFNRMLANIEVVD